MTTALVLRASELPDIATAALPATYERARDALVACQRIDECKDWADKAAALASYAKQADDQTLHTMAVRIQARAMRRAGELLEEFQSVGGRPSKTSGGAPTSSQRKAAKDAGLSKDQEVTARRVASIPEADFEAAIEGDDPPTVTALADRGTEKRPSTAPPGFADATHVLGVMRELAAFCAAHSALVVGAAMLPHEVEAFRADIAAVDQWLTICSRYAVGGDAC